mmetsp:Transcript_2859/g.8844  ORF Transcript_2859/g.8844 Transcript_2859/m.8844 type:complete len:245 (+) Transcript_2859:1559-2293(+)
MCDRGLRRLRILSRHCGCLGLAAWRGRQGLHRLGPGLQAPLDLHYCGGRQADVDVAGAIAPLHVEKRSRLHAELPDVTRAGIVLEPEPRGGERVEQVQLQAVQAPALPHAEEGLEVDPVPARRVRHERVVLPRLLVLHELPVLQHQEGVQPQLHGLPVRAVAHDPEHRPVCHDALRVEEADGCPLVLKDAKVQRETEGGHAPLLGLGPQAVDALCGVVHQLPVTRQHAVPLRLLPAVGPQGLLA